MYVSDYLDVVWSRLVEQYGGFDSPMEFREMLHDIVFKGVKPKEREKPGKSKRSAGAKHRGVKPDMSKIREIQERLGKGKKPPSPPT